MNKTHWWHDLADLLIFVWNKTATVSALALMAGGLAMSLYYTISPKAVERNVEIFEGFFNHAGNELPEGLGESNPLAPRENRSHVRFEYDSKGRLARVYHHNAQGELSAIPGSLVAEQSLSYDDNGKLTSKKNRDADGLPVHDASGVHERRFAYDAKGNLIETSYWDKNHARTMPYTPGFAIERISYDEQNRPIEKRYLDSQEKPIANNLGSSHLKITYEDGGHTIKNYHKDELSNNSHGYAIERHHFSNNGLTERIDWYDAQGNPVINEEEGYASIQIEHSPDTRYKRVLYLCDEGQQLASRRILSEHLIKYNEKGQPRWESYLAHDGLPLDHHEHNYAECAREYDQKNRLSKAHYRDANGALADCYEQRYSYAPDGNRVLSLYRDGSTATRVMK